MKGWLLWNGLCKLRRENVPLSPDGAEEIAAPGTQLFLLLLSLLLN